MATKHLLKDSMWQLLKANRHGSFETQKKREIELMQMITDLVKGGYKITTVHSLKPKHIDFLNGLWAERGLSPGTIKNKAVQLRWWATMTHKASIMKSNDELGLAKRSYIPTKSKAIDLTKIDLKVLNDQHIEASLRLQYHLGLRREESLKIRPYLADKGDHLELQGSWCKGGRSRTIPILTKEAREAVDFAKSIVVSRGDSLIPNHKSYRAQKHYYEYKTAEIGLKNPHGLRHAYAQNQYKTLTGWECPLNGGLRYKELSTDQKRLDYEARMIISEYLGHSRVNIVVNYCGK